ncbi:MAG TPA: hypothetical protein PLG72_10945, partial [Clostridiales bacterium]|nr:hypothetical protein [Clostridiales bacterium]
MKRYCCFILSALITSLFLLTGCNSDAGGRTGDEHTADAEEAANAPNISASTNLEGDILFY